MSRDLDEGETLLFKLVCKKLDLPLQPPVTVKFFNSKKVSIIDKPTGRAIVYTLCATNALSFPSIVSLDQSPLMFGKVQDIFHTGKQSLQVLRRSNVPSPIFMV